MTRCEGYCGLCINLEPNAKHSSLKSMQHYPSGAVAGQTMNSGLYGGSVSLLVNTGLYQKDDYVTLLQ